MTKNQEYESYVEEHQKSILTAFYRLKGWIDYDKHEWKEIEENIKEHDWSKKIRPEFSGYRFYFFPEDGEEKDVEGFDKAWLHHIQNNPHHWEHYVIPVKNIATEMPFKYIIEMLLDWQAMSYKFGDSIIEFYEKKKDEMILHEKTILIVEKWLQIIDYRCVEHLR